jgi:hypothetical protein
VEDAERDAREREVEADSTLPEASPAVPSLRPIVVDAEREGVWLRLIEGEGDSGTPGGSFFSLTPASFEGEGLHGLPAPLLPADDMFELL